MEMMNLSSLSDRYFALAQTLASEVTGACDNSNAGTIARGMNLV